MNEQTTSPDVSRSSPPVTQPVPRERKADLATNMRMAVLRLSRKLRNEATGEISESQYSVLSALFHLGPMTAGTLAERDHVSRPSMTRTVGSLESRDLVARRVDEADKRHVVVQITEAGAATVKDIKRRRTAWLDKRLARLAPAERQTLAEAAEIMRKVVEQ